jgi:integrase
VRSHSNRIRFDFPTVDYRPSNGTFLVDARHHVYPGKKSGQYMFKDRDKALAKAEEIAAFVADTQITAPNLPSSVLAKLESLGVCPYEILNRALAAHNSTAQITLLGQAHTEFLQFKESENIEPRSKRSVIKRVNHFVVHFRENTPLSAITLKQVEGYLNLTTSPGNFNTWRQHINAFYNFCVKKHRWISENPVDRIPFKKVRLEVETFSPPQIESLLRATYVLQAREGEMMRLYVVLGVFAGLRPEEAQRLRWEDINFEDECVVISKMRSKTSRPRVIPFEPNFKSWLNTIPRGSIGGVYNQKNHRNQFDRLLVAAGMKKSDWIQDGLRHTYGSARWLIDKDMYRLARHMGNSERVCIDHYLSTSMTKATAQALFAITPPADA